MAILSHPDYLLSWTAPAPHGFGQTICPPCYHEYLQREIYFHDYLDLFKNHKTFGRINHHGRFFAKISGCPILGILGIPEHETLTVNLDGELYLLVDYDYPWTNEELKKKRCIKYVMIAEACPELGVNYFYDITMIQGQGYLKAAYDATYNRLGPAIPWAPLHHPTDKINKLLDLALRGVLLVDIFPFAIDYKIKVLHLKRMRPIREVLNDIGITNSFFNDAFNLYSVTNRVADLICKGLTCVDFMNGTNSVLIAPTKISYHLAHQINIIPPIVTTPLIFGIGENSARFLPPHILRGNYFFHNIPAGNTLAGIPIPLAVPPPPFTIMVPRYICCAYSGAHIVPHAFFITNALL